MFAILGWLVYSAYRVKATEDTIRANLDSIAKQEQVIAANQKKIEQLTPGGLTGFGWDPDTVRIALRNAEQPRVEQSLLANDALSRYAAKAGGRTLGPTARSWDARRSPSIKLSR